MTAVLPGACTCCTDCWGKLEVLDPTDTEEVIYPLSLNKQAWCVTNGADLWLGPIQRGVNVIIPGLPGRWKQPRRPDQTDYALRFIISGVVDPDDAPNDDEDQGLVDNQLYLRANALDALTPPSTARNWRLTSPDGGTVLETPVQGPENGQPLVTRYQNRGLWIGTLHIVIPAGSF